MNLEPVLHRETKMEKGWQIDFTPMPSCKEFKYLLALVDTFLGRIEVFLAETEGVSVFIEHIITPFGLP